MTEHPWASPQKRCQLHVTVEFPQIPALGPLHFRAEQSAAQVFVAAMSQWHASAVVVRVDRAVNANMRLLPCHRLFEQS